MPVNISDQLFEEFLPQNLDFLFNWNGLRKQPTAYDRFAHNSYVKDFPVQRKGHLNVVNLLSWVNELDWGKLARCITDGAPFMPTRKSGFKAHVKALSPPTTFFHYLIH